MRPRATRNRRRQFPHGQPSRTHTPPASVLLPLLVVASCLAAGRRRRALIEKGEHVHSDFFEADLPVPTRGFCYSSTLRHTLQLTPGSRDLSDWALLDDGSIGFVQLAAAVNSDGRIALVGITSTELSVLHRAQRSPGSWAAPAHRPGFRNARGTRPVDMCKRRCRHGVLLGLTAISASARGG